MPAEVPAQAPRRRDAQRNRERILAATRAAFQERGLDVGVDEIARRAGVGVGTLYRHFPTKDALVDAILEVRFQELSAAAGEALEEPDPWTGFGRFLHRAAELQAADRGFKDALSARRRNEPIVKQARAGLRRAIGRLVERAQQAGALRDDVVAEDVLAMLWATGRVVERAADAAPAQVGRFVTVLLDGLRAGDTTAMPGPPMTTRQFGRAIDARHGVPGGR